MIYEFTKKKTNLIVLEDIENYMVISNVDLRSGNDYFSDAVEDEDLELEDLECEGCGFLMNEDEDFVESEYEEDVYHHNSAACRLKYLIKNDLLVGSRSLAK